ncbi:MAG: hypothetical protein HY890_04385 [Deltaproteobacteria bacterium]|nr:hypothetical protein [Deltaproteobacteria bacterium]
MDSSETKSVASGVSSGFTALIFMSLLLAACQAVKVKKAAPIVVSGFFTPESVIADPAGKRFFVSDIGPAIEMSAKDGDGYISELSPEGEILHKRYLPKSGVLNAPKGMAIIGNTLYVADIDRIVAFDLTTRDEVFELDFSSEKTVFLNDLAVFDDHTLFVSSTDTGKIYKVSLGHRPEFSVLAEGILGANGLYYDKKGNRLFVVGFGKGFIEANGEVGVIRLAVVDGRLAGGERKYQKFPGVSGAFEGVALLPDDRLVFSDWTASGKPGVMRVYDLNTGELSVFKLSEDIRGLADFFYDRDTGKLWLPNMMDGKILIENAR